MISIQQTNNSIQKPIEMKAILNSVRSKIDKSLSLTIQTPPLDTNQKVIIMDLQREPILLRLTPQNNVEAPVEIVNREINTKTQSARLRNTLYIYWQQTDKQNGVLFEEFYMNKMEQLIEHFKEKLHE